ncbi:Hpt domain-containing protein [Pseudarthrobacter sp. 1C304]|uniref:Hpt domain-containing protein n=1 Tax=Pseudarthrobacter sp. 1C304 TaxID=3457438 RepID=UPI003FD47818
MAFHGIPGDGDPNNSPNAGACLCGGNAVPAAADGVALPLVDPAALEELGSQLDSPAVAQVFARDYANMWDHRYHALAVSLDNGDHDAALDAVLSLKTSSAMVGGVRLAELAGELENAIRIRDTHRAQTLLSAVAESGNDTVDELQHSYELGES